MQRLGSITTENEYQTDAGANVLVGQAPSFGPGDPTSAIAVTVEDDEPVYQGENVTITLPLVVHACVKADVGNPYLAAEAVVADIKRAVEADHNLGGLALPRGLMRGATKAALREAGSEYVAARVEYRVMYAERWGQP